MTLLAFLAAGAAWRVWLELPVKHWDSSFISLAFGLLPYVVVWGLGNEARLRTVATLCAAVVLAADVLTVVAAQRSASSTAGVAVLLAPLATALLAALVVGGARLIIRKS